MLRGRTALVVAVIALATAVAACDSGYHYVKSSEDKTYFKVPDRWRLYDEESILDRIGEDLTESERQTELEQTWRVAFDAAPEPSLGHIGSPEAGHPSGIAVVRRLTFDDADIMSNATLRNYFFDVDTALDEGGAEILEYEELQLDGGFRGIHLVATLPVGDRRITIDQTALLDQATSKLYALLVSCSTTCYEEHEGDIAEVVESWTVRDT